MRERAESAPAPAKTRLSSFDHLIDDNGRALYRLAYRMVGQPTEAEDIAQEALFRAYRRLDDFVSDDHFAAGVRRIASNLAIDHLRRRKRWRSQDLDSLETVAPLRSSDAAPDRSLRSDEIGEHLHAALDRLTPKERVAFTLRHLEGHSMKEIAAITGINVNSTKNHVFRAVRKLRDALAPLKEDPR